MVNLTVSNLGACESINDNFQRMADKGLPFADEAGKLTVFVQLLCFCTDYSTGVLGVVFQNWFSV
jgi:hypothetical protein